MFEDALMESSNRIKTRSRYWSPLAVLINCGVLIALIIWPLLHPDALPVQIMAALLVAPSPPPPAPLAQITQPRYGFGPSYSTIRFKHRVRSLKTSSSIKK